MIPPSPVEKYIKRNESFRADAYDDATGRLILPGHAVVGTLTIAWGHTGPDVYPGQTFTQDAAEILFQRDLTAAVRGAIASVGTEPWLGLTPPRRGALADMCFELGEYGLMDFHKLLAAVRAGDWQTAHDNVLLKNPPDPTPSAYAVQVPSRAASNAAILLSGEWPRGIA
jgi:GH24 family phage-related lysozyme (muramidase)